MTTQITNFDAELGSAQTAIEPELEGFKDLFRTLTEEDGPEVRNDIRNAITNNEARLRQLNETRTAIARLQATGYPAPVAVQMSPASAAKAREQATSINAALARISGAGEATTGIVNLGPVSPI